jgi:CRP-like cAMP-binding protein
MPEECDCRPFLMPFGSEIESLLQRFSDIEALRYLNDEFLVKEGNVDKDIFLVLRGSMVVEQSGEDRGILRPSTLAMISCEPKSPSFIGEMAYLGSCKRTASVRCVGAVTTLKLTPSHLSAILDDYPALTRLLCRQFTMRLKETSEHLSKLEKNFSLQARHLFKKEGAKIFVKGEPANMLYQVIDGAVALEGKEGSIPPENFRESFLGLKEYLLELPYQETIRATTPVMLVAIEKSSRIAFIRNYPELVLDVLKSSYSP